MKKNAPKAILSAAVIIALAIVLRADDFVLATEARAAVGGKDYRALERDPDFGRAVKTIVEGCRLSGNVEGYQYGNFPAEQFFLNPVRVDC